MVGYTWYMKVMYQQYKIVVKFEKILSFGTNPVFLFRSILGMNLHDMACINSRCRRCDECIFNQTCVYATLFESCIDKENTVLPGREKSLHPYVLSLEEDVTLHKQVDRLILNLTMFGDFIKYLPYIVGAFQNAGKKGFGKERIPFMIEDITVDGVSIYRGERLVLDTPVKVWTFDYSSYDSGESVKTGQVLIQLKSPLRYKSQGKFVSQPTAKDFMLCLYRRMWTICSLYGECSESEIFNFDTNTMSITDSQIRWVNYERWSARQKSSMLLGGMTGVFTLEGKFSSYDLSLIDSARLFGTGKNTNFGLGQVDYWERLEA